LRVFCKRYLLFKITMTCVRICAGHLCLITKLLKQKVSRAVSIFLHHNSLRLCVLDRGLDNIPDGALTLIDKLLLIDRFTKVIVITANTSRNLGKEYIEVLLQKSDNNISEASKLSGISRPTLYSMMKKLGIGV
jgi:transcriptional regulator of acetoin/glycerol metabolism